jgi:ligand-binding sensor domain-containing protein
MKNTESTYIKAHLLFILLVIITSCNGQDKTIAQEKEPITSKTETKTIIKETQITYGTPLLGGNTTPIGEIVVRRVFQDSKGTFWFGTNGNGVIRYTENTLEYFSINEGFGGIAVRGIVEDKMGNIWFATSGGLTKYNGKSFTNYTKKDGLVDNNTWCLTIDNLGVIWVGTLEGVSNFNGTTFTPFNLPKGKSDPNRGVTSAKIVHSIIEDSKGNMWFGTNGGAYIYDGKSLTNLSEEDGLCDNNVNAILEDKNGIFWFATSYQSICSWDGKTFTNFTEKDGIKGPEGWSLYEDSKGNIWFPIEHSGVYKFDGKTFTNFHDKDGLASGAIQTICEDSEGIFWLGGWMSLYRYDGTSFLKVTQ